MFSMSTVHREKFIFSVQLQNRVARYTLRVCRLVGYDNSQSILLLAAWNIEIQTKIKFVKRFTIVQANVIDRLLYITRELQDSDNFDRQTSIRQTHISLALVSCVSGCRWWWGGRGVRSGWGAWRGCCDSYAMQTCFSWLCFSIYCDNCSDTRKRSEPNVCDNTLAAILAHYSTAAEANKHFAPSQTAQTHRQSLSPDQQYCRYDLKENCIKV